MKKIIAWLLIILFFLLTVVDLGLTFYNTPDLSREANPLVTVFGWGWPALIVSNILVQALYSFLVYYAWVTYPEKKKKARAGNGKAGNATLALIGYTLSFTMIVSRFIVVAEWAQVTFGKGFGAVLELIHRLPTARQDLVLACGLGIFFAVQWTLCEMLEERSYKKALHKERF